MRTSRGELLAVFAGGIVGTLMRAGLVELAGVPAGEWPWATLIANVAGAVAIGWLTARIGDLRPFAPHRLAFVGTGLCGGLTTFSTVQVELVRMLDAGETGLAAGYAATSIVLGLAAVGIASRLAERRRVAIA